MHGEQEDEPDMSDDEYVQKYFALGNPQIV